MYPTKQKMDAPSSGTGVFYQAVPAIGADGTNIMKLIPVQMVNGQFYRIQIHKPKTNPTPQQAATVDVPSAPVQVVKKPAVNPPATQQTVRKQVSLINALPNPGGSGLLDLLNSRPQQQPTVNLKAKGPPMTTPATNCKESVLSQLGVTVKSAAIPIGQYLNIPPNAQVRTVSASELPPGMKKTILSPGPGLPPCVVYVSPITTVSKSTTTPNASTLSSLKLLPKTSTNASSGPPSIGSKKHLKLIPEVSKRPNSPIKWTIEEEDSSTTQTLDPISSPTITSEILMAVAEREHTREHCDVNPKPVSQMSQGKSHQTKKGQGNPLVVCNGKVFFVSRMSNLADKTEKSVLPADTTKRFEFNKIIVPSSSQPEPNIQKDNINAYADESDEVIDLCDDDDDAQEDSSQQASVNMSAGTHVDEDNVIFVSYIPPKPASRSAQDAILKPHMETEHLDTGLNCVTEQKSQGGAAGCDGRGAEMSLGTVKSLPHDCDSAGNEGSDIKSRQCTATQTESMEVDVELESPADPSSCGACSQREEDTHKTEGSMNPETSLTSSLAPELSRKADHLLRQLFSITADVKVCLQRIDEASAESVAAELLRSVEDHHERESLCSSQETDRVKLVNVLTEHKLSADPTSPHTPAKCSDFKLNTNAFEWNSNRSSLEGASSECEPVMGYVEPIDEDFLSTDENDDSQYTDIQSPACVDVITNTRRIGRARKRTICLCCIPGTQVPAVKSSAKSAEQGKWTWVTETKKGVKTKAVRNKTSGRSGCLTHKKTSEVPVSNSLSTTSMDSELEKQKRVKRPNELVRMRNGSS